MFHPIEHWVLNFLKTEIGLSFKTSAQIKQTKQTKVLLAVSGGVDSMVMLHLLKRTEKVHGLDLHVASIHHGDSEKLDLQSFRDNSLSLVEKECLNLGLPFYFKKYFTKDDLQVSEDWKNEQDLKEKSEAFYRQFRYDFFHHILKQNNLDFLMTAHHVDDLIETRLMRLLRGVGPEGLVSILPQNGIYLRPLLGLTKKEIQSYAHDHHLPFCEDPSNQSDEYFRNWIRIHWMSPLQKDHPDKIKSLFRSLQNLSSPVAEETFENIPDYKNGNASEDPSRSILSNALSVAPEYLNWIQKWKTMSSLNQEGESRDDLLKKVQKDFEFQNNFIRRNFFSRQMKVNKLAILQKYIQLISLPFSPIHPISPNRATNENIISEFRHSQLEEIIKQLDKVKTVHTFVVNSLAWRMNEERIWVEFLSKK